LAGEITFEMDSDTWGTLQATLGKGLEKALAKAGVSLAMSVLEDIQTSIIPGSTPHVPVDRGIYRASWKSKGKLSGDAGDGLMIYSSAPHAPFIEDGVRAENVKPGRAMIDALTEWVIRKGMVDKQSAKSRAKAFTAHTDTKGVPKAAFAKTMTKNLVAQEARGIAFAIAHAMKSKGIFHGGLHVLAKAIDNVRPKVGDFITKAVEEVFS
jgi:hypothetical protein